MAFLQPFTKLYSAAKSRILFKPVLLLRCSYSKYSDRLQPKLEIPKTDLKDDSVLAKNTNTSSKELIDSVQWTPVYRFGFAPMARVVVRAKIYQTALTVYFFGSSFIAFQTGNAALSSLLFTTGISAFACFMLYVFGNIFSRLIGFAYLSEDKSKIRLAHLTFWGQRKDTVVEVDDMLPFDTLIQRYDDWYCLLSRVSDPKDRYYLSLKFGGILDKENFERAFKANLPQTVLSRSGKS
ncbi:Transmembrane protein [Halotydeus destructor]|nr:Transmembrane protein [Halotydeus destructor]